MKKILTLLLLISPMAFAQPDVDGDKKIIILAQFGGLNCGVKPVPRVGYEIGRCVNGQWEQVSKSGLGGALSCGVKPVPRVGYEIGRCVNGQWEQVSKSGFGGAVNCGVKPIPRVGYKIGRCVNGQWEQVSR